MSDKPTVTVNGLKMDSEKLALMAVRCKVPRHCAMPLAEYLTGENRHPGHFLTAVLKNDLKDAVMRADIDNMSALGNYIEFLYSYAPTDSYGSEEKFNAWIRRPECTKPN